MHKKFIFVYSLSIPVQCPSYFLNQNSLPFSSWAGELPEKKKKTRAMLS